MSTCVPFSHSSPTTSDLSGLNFIPINSKYSAARLALSSIPGREELRRRASSTNDIAVTGVLLSLER